MTKQEIVKNIISMIKTIREKGFKDTLSYALKYNNQINYDSLVVMERTLMYKKKVFLIALEQDLKDILLIK